MRCRYACGSAEHSVSRRTFFSTAAVGGMTALVAGHAQPVLAEKLATTPKRILNIFLHGGVSQLESWDPKPGTDTGGPFRPI